jgi:hypothetical protein
MKMTFNMYTQPRTDETTTRRNFLGSWTVAGLAQGAGLG